MEDRKTLGIAVIAFSVMLAFAILVILLLVATASTPDQFRQVDVNGRYLQQAMAAVSRGLEVAQSQERPLQPDVPTLDQALGAGSDGLAEAVASIYEPASPLDRVRIPLMRWTNLIDTSARTLAESSLVVESQRLLGDRMVNARTQLAEFASAQAELAEVREFFDQRVNGLIGSLRESGRASLADTLYVHAEQIRGHVKQGQAADLDAALALVDDVQKLESALAVAERPSVRQIVNTVYTLVSIRRTMLQAVSLMDLPALETQLLQLRSLTTNDQLYVLQAVNDARVLLNVYTLLLLIVLAFFGVRLRASHAALNRSHEDLERRVEERTQDLEQANTDLKESQVQLVQAEKMSSLGQLVAGVMHEINTPLLYVLNNTTVTAEAVQDLGRYLDATLPVMRAKNSEDGKEAIKHMLSKRSEFNVDELVENIAEIDSLAHDSIDGLNQISELVQSLKDFSRLDRVAEDTFDVREGIEKTLLITKNLLKHGVEVKLDFADVPEIHCSPSRLNQVFINLLTNAVQAMDGKGVLSIRTRATQNDCVEIVFEDTGCGIPEEHLANVMDPFFTTKPVGEGTGLGLSIVRQIIDQHEGQILIDSKVGHGTRITLSLPVGGPSATASDGEQAA